MICTEALVVRSELLFTLAGYGDSLLTECNECNQLGSRLRDVSFNHGPRSSNMVAHEVNPNLRYRLQVPLFFFIAKLKVKIN